VEVVPFSSIFHHPHSTSPKDMPKTLVVVESPTKAKTIRKFLPPEYVVEASMGHVRDLPDSAADIPEKYKGQEWARLGVNVEEDFAPLYVTPKGKGKTINELKAKLKNAEALYLATDEDREGESIAWHLVQSLKPKVPVRRMVFHEITKPAIQRALQETRELDEKLVSAQETRRVLDRLFGYTLSPLLWKKIGAGLSAGRVQSAALKLLVDRERERAKFQKAVYWDLLAKLFKDSNFDARLQSVGGVRIATGKDFDENTGRLAEGKKDVRVLSEQDAADLRERLLKASWIVKSVTEKATTARPSIPFITSTLQQEGNRKLGLSARETMRIAQRLYEEGYITYMRTDSPALSSEAIGGARKQVQELFGDEYLSPAPRQFAAKSKAAQEAHEAIRPAGANFRHPRETGLEGRELAVYNLIWKRTLATQMADARKLSIGVLIAADDAIFSANGTRILFPGFLRVYVEGSDDPEAALEDREVLLPALKEGDVARLDELLCDEHETKPPARFTEASLVQALEKEGIGRPSTYATIIGTIQERGYVRKNGNALIPTFTGFAVIQLLERYFEQLVNLGFTSQMEQSLDNIAAGELESLPYLKKFYLGETGLQNQVREREAGIDPGESRTVTLPQLENLQVRVGRYGAYVVGKDNEEERANLPDDLAPADIRDEGLQELLSNRNEAPEALGIHPQSGEDIFVLTGRYGPYVQLGEVSEDNPKPRRASIPRGVNPASLTVEQAVELLMFPRELGLHPETGKPVAANKGRFGPYVMHDGEFRSLKKEDDLMTVSLERALELLAIPKPERPGRFGKKSADATGKAGAKPATKKAGAKKSAAKKPAKKRSTKKTAK
jgi:DNA topoisomerase-1